MTTDRNIFIEGWHARNAIDHKCPYYKHTGEYTLWWRGWYSCSDEHSEVYKLMAEVRT